MKILFVIMASLFSMFSLFSSARSLTSKVLAKANTIVYTYGNYTLPPDCRTPVKYIVTADSVVIEKAKGEQTTRTAYPITPQQFGQFKEELEKCKIKCREHGRQSLACGGASYYFEVTDASGDRIFRAHGYMAGRMSGQLRYKYSPEDVYLRLIEKVSGMKK